MDDTKLIADGKAKPGFNIVEFARQTRREINKVTWPTRHETVVTTLFVVGMAVVVGLFFFAVDSLLGYAVGSILGMKG